MLLNVCKQTFHISRVRVSQKVKGILMSNLHHVNLIGRQRYWKIFIFSYTHFTSCLLLLFSALPSPWLVAISLDVMKEMKVIIHKTCLECNTGDEIAVFSQNLFVPKSFAIFENKNSNIFLSVEMNGMSKHNITANGQADRLGRWWDIHSWLQ